MSRKPDVYTLINAVLVECVHDGVRTVAYWGVGTRLCLAQDVAPCPWWKFWTKEGA